MGNWNPEAKLSGIWFFVFKKQKNKKQITAEVHIKCHNFTFIFIQTVGKKNTRQHTNAVVAMVCFTLID